jgi:uncharacterized protein (DUF2267 family)
MAALDVEMAEGRGRKMAASEHSVRDVLRVIKKHVDQATLEKIMDELLDVPGNESFRETIQKLAEAVQYEKADKRGPS